VKTNYYLDDLSLYAELLSGLTDAVRSSGGWKGAESPSQELEVRALRTKYTLRSHTCRSWSESEALLVKGLGDFGVLGW